jgi:ribonuclease P protein component
MPGFVLLVRDRADEDPAMRLGITVTKKIGNAVVRNRMKRRFRALAREVLPEAGVSGADHVMIGRSGGIERDFAQLREELRKALRKLSDGGKRKSASPEPVEGRLTEGVRVNRASTGSALASLGSGRPMSEGSPQP